MKKDICIIFCTVPSKEIAKTISITLLKKKLAACVNIIPKITSFYFWKNKLEQNYETQIIIKTFIKLKSLILIEIKKIHPYEIPEFLIIKTHDVDNKYFSWINNCLN